MKRRLLWIVSDIQTRPGPQTREFCGLAPHHLYSQYPFLSPHPTTPRIQAFTSPFPPNFPPKVHRQAACDSLLARIDNTARSIVTSLILRRTGPSVVSPRVRPEPACSGAARRVRIPGTKRGPDDIEIMDAGAIGISTKNCGTTARQWLRRGPRWSMTAYDPIRQRRRDVRGLRIHSHQLPSRAASCWPRRGRDIMLTKARAQGRCHPRRG